MKKVKISLVFVVSLFITISLFAQDKPNNYFVGKWDVLVEGTPAGDSHMPLLITLENGKFFGGLLNDKDSVTSKFDKIEAIDNSITLYFNAGGYNLYISLDKVDENNATGTLKDMFDATAKRVIKKENSAE